MSIYLDILVNFLESVGYTFFIYKYIAPKQNFKNQYILILLIISTLILTISSYINQVDQISLFVLNIITFFFCYRYSKNKPLEILFLLFFIETLIIISNISILTLDCYFFQNTVSNIFNNSSELIVISIISKIIFCLLSYISSKFINKRNYVYNQSILLLLIITVVTFFCIVYGFTNLITGYFMLYQVIPFLVGFSVTLVFTYILFNIIKEENYQNMLKDIEHQELEDMKFFLDATKIINDENARLKHCINSISLLTKGDKVDFKDSVNSKINNIQYTPQFIYSKNITINNIVNPIIYLNPDLSWKIIIESDLANIDKLDTAIILSCILKIAVKYVDKEKRIQLITKKLNNIYLISVQISSGNIINTEIILKKLEKTIEKYDGKISMESKDNICSIDLVIKNCQLKK